MDISSYIIGSTVWIGCISPLLTLLYLWQVKEWRIDRLKEHLRSEGYLQQLFGKVRPAIIFATGIAMLIGIINETTGTLLLAGVLALLSITQIILKRQPLPVWTHKAKLLCITAISINSFIIVYAVLHGPIVTITLPLLVVVQPIVAMCTWALWKPIDTIAKQSILIKAKRLREQHNLLVIGVTGSVGKTTTKELLAHILDDRNPLVTPAHVNSEMGVAKWFLKNLGDLSNSPDQEPRITIVEMGAYTKGEIELLCNIAQPTLGIITYVGTQHIALFGSQENLCKAKAELIESLPANGCAFLNADSTLCASLDTKALCPVTKISTGGTADIEAYNIEETEDGVSLEIEGRTIQTHICGTHNVTNILLAYAVAKHLGMEPANICTKLETFDPPPHTFILTQKDGIDILDDSHNASRESFKAAIEWAGQHAADHKILITPGLIELGAQQDIVHTELGALSQSVFDRVIFTSQKSAAAFEKGFGRNVEYFSQYSASIPKGSLIVSEGRIGKKTMNKIYNLIQST